MSDVTAAGPAPAAAAPTGGFQFPSLGAIGVMLKRGDIALAIGVLTILVVLILPLPPILLDLCAGDLDHPVGADPDDGAVHPDAAGILRLPDRAADRDDAAAVAQPRLDPADPGARPRGHRRRRPRHRGVRQLRDERQLRHRHHRLHHPGDRELRRHHQGLRPHRRSRRALPPGRHAGQADGDRRRSLRRPDRRERPRASAARTSRTKAASSAPWTAPRSSCAATPSPACWWCSSTSSAA